MLADPPTPATIGPYRVVRPIGKGGMGMVYEAVHNAIERRVAIKLLNPEYARDAEVTARFFNEARAVNLIDHPSIVQISDYGQLPDGTAYIVMELLKGESLQARLQRQGRMSIAQALRVAWQLAAALAVAHTKGIIHRDLKPDNVMLVADSLTTSGLRAKLLDFGIAKLIEANRTQTNINAVMGTPQYMSPEQCKGAGEVDDRSDVYSFGLMLFEMLAARPPFMAEAPWQIIGMHLFQAPPTLASLVPTIPAAIDQFVAQLLVKDRAQRPAMQRVQRELEELMASYGSTTGSISASISAVPATDGLSSAAHSTLGALTGQSAFDRGTPRIRRLSLVVAGCVLGLGLLLTTWKLVAPSRPVAQPRPDATAAPGPLPSPQQRTVRWSIVTIPAGAEVLDQNGLSRGQTPWQHEQPVGSGTATFKLRKPGYEERRITLDQNANENRQEVLKSTRRGSSRSLPPKASPGAPPSAPPPTAPQVPARQYLVPELVD